MLDGSLGLSGYGFHVPLLEGEHVTDDTGTGFVHTAPGHGREDFEVWTTNASELEESLIAGGRFGGTFGVVTVVYALAVGPLVHLLLPRLTVPLPAPATTTVR